MIVMMLNSIEPLNSLTPWLTRNLLDLRMVLVFPQENAVFSIPQVLTVGVTTFGETLMQNRSERKRYGLR